MPAFTLKQGDKVLFIGDSITDASRRDQPPLGNGYVSIFKDLADSLRPELKLNVINKGISGNTALDLRERWEDDVIALNPNVISVMIGINDVHRYLSGDVRLSVDHYAEAYRDVLEITSKRLNAEIVLLSPFYISKAKEMDTFRKKVLETLPDYIRVVEGLSKEFSTAYLDLHREFKMRLEYLDPETFAPEPVHPNRRGHTLIALKLSQLLLV
jgi:lysophospholipase L1-like esterase